MVVFLGEVSEKNPYPKLDRSIKSPSNRYDINKKIGIGDDEKV